MRTSYKVPLRRQDLVVELALQLMRFALRNANQEKGALTAPVIELAVEIFTLVRSLICRSPVRSMVVHRGLSLGDLIEQFLSLQLQFQGSSS